MGHCDVMLPLLWAFLRCYGFRLRACKVWLCFNNYTSMYCFFWGPTGMSLWEPWQCQSCKIFNSTFQFFIIVTISVSNGFLLNEKIRKGLKFGKFSLNLVPKLNLLLYNEICGHRRSVKPCFIRHSLCNITVMWWVRIKQNWEFQRLSMFGFSSDFCEWCTILFS